MKIAGIDCGQSGALALLNERGKWIALEDMPVIARKAGGFSVDAIQLGEILRGWMPDLVCVEQVSAMTRPDITQGVSSIFRLGESFGMVRGVIGCLKIPVVFYVPRVWKKSYGIEGENQKEQARAIAIQRFPEAAHELKRKKDSGRAESLLIAAHGYQRECPDRYVQEKERQSFLGIEMHHPV